MAVTLAEAKNSASEAYNAMVVDDFRKSSAILDNLEFDQAVNPAGGSTLTYGYRRLKTERAAAFRAYNTEYTPAEAVTEKIAVDLHPLGGTFQIDRAIAPVGTGDSNAMEVQITQLIKATTAKFNDAFINGDSATDANSFDGLDKALTGKDTEYNADGTKTYDWSATTEDSAFGILDALDELMADLNGEATAIVANKYALARIRAAVRRTSAYVREPVDDLTANGRPIMRETYGGILLIDAGAKSGSNGLVIPMTTGKTDIYVYRANIADGLTGVTTTAGNLVTTYLPDLSQPGAVKTGEVELGPVALALKSTKAAAVLRGVKVR